MQALIIILGGILGVIIGSFLNVVIFRINTGWKITGRSKCLSCGRQLKWYELVPVLSFISLRGKCKSCQSPISWQYPIVELLTGLLFAGIFWREGFVDQPVTFALLLILVAVGVVIAVYDSRHQIIPKKPLIWFFILSLVLGLHIKGFVILALPFLLLWLLSRGTWIGFGDIELIACIGALLGTFYGLIAVVLSFWIASVVVLPWFGIQYLRKRRPSHKIAFGPFILLAGYLVMVFRPEILIFIQIVLQ